MNNSLSIKAERIYGLDVMRVIALLIVLVQHCSLDYEVVGRTKIGLYALEIFFVLSGFLIGGILFRDLDKGHSSRSTLLTFLYRRWWRILPLYYLVLLAEWLNNPEIPARVVARYAIFFQNFRMHPSFFTHSWSVAVEEWFYLAAPLFVILVCRKFTKPKQVITAFLLFILAITLLRLTYLLTRETMEKTYWVMKALPPLRFDSLFCGIFLAYLHHIKHPVFDRLNKRSWFISGTLFCVGYVALVHFGVQTSLKPVLAFVLPVVGFIALSAAITLTIPYAMQWRRPEMKTGFGKAVYWVVTYGSVMSYAIYLIHPFFYEWINIHSGFGKSFLVSLQSIVHSEFVAYTLLFVLRTTLVLTGAYIIYRLLDKPILKLRDKLTGVKGVSLPS